MFRKIELLLLSSTRCKNELLFRSDENWHPFHPPSFSLLFEVKEAISETFKVRILTVSTLLSLH
jgi:hypothetical protein